MRYSASILIYFDVFRVIFYSNTMCHFTLFQQLSHRLLVTPLYASYNYASLILTLTHIQIQMKARKYVKQHNLVDTEPRTYSIWIKSSITGWWNALAVCLIRFSSHICNQLNNSGKLFQCYFNLTLNGQNSKWDNSFVQKSSITCEFLCTT